MMGQYRCVLFAVLVVGMTMVRTGVCGDVSLLQPDVPPGDMAALGSFDSQGPKYMHLAQGSFDPLEESKYFQTIRIPGSLRTDRPDSVGPYYLLQFKGPIREEWKNSLKTQGVRFYGYVPEDAFLVKWKGDAPTLLSGNPFVRAVVPYRPFYKLDGPVLGELKLSELGGRNVGLSTVGRRDTEIGMVAVPASFLPSREYVILCYPDADPEAVDKEIRAAGGEVLTRTQSEFKTRFKVRLNPRALIPEVNWIESAPEWRLFNEKAGATGVMDVHPIWQSLGLFGAGQVVAVADTGLDNGSVAPAELHDDFENGTGGSRVVQLFDLVGDGASDTSGHGTHVAGSVLGNGARSGSNPPSHTYPATAHAGMAPEASLVFQAHMENASGRLTGVPSDLNTLFDQAAGAGAKIHTDSWGSDSAGGYSSHSQDVDEYIWTHRDFSILFAAGNSGTDKYSPAGVIDEFSVGEPGTAKNCITVGASENNRPATGNPSPYGTLWPDDFPNAPVNTDPISDNVNGMVAFSGRGPCLDGRYKPDIVAPGTNILSVRSAVAPDQNFWAPFNADYAYMGGTSMATPLTCGLTTLIREYLQKMAGQANPSAALIKAVLLNGAVELNPGQYGTGAAREIAHNAPNDTEGWGRANLAGSLPSGTRNVLLVDDTQGLTTGNQVDYTFQVNGGDHPLRVKLVWSDYPGNPAAAGGLVNDLNLSLIKPDQSTVKPLFPRSPGYIQSLENASDVNGFVRPANLGDALIARFTPVKTPFNVIKVSFLMAAAAPGTYAVDFSILDDNGGVPGAVVASLPGLGVDMYNQVGEIYLGSSTITATGIALNGPFYVAITWSTTLDAYLGYGLDAPRTGNDFLFDSTAGTTIPWDLDGERDLYITVMGKGAESDGPDDSVNNVEGIEIPAPATGTYKVRVVAQRVAQGPQPFAVVISGNVSSGSQPTPTATPTISPTATPPSSPPGDVNLDGSVTPADAQMAFDYFLGTQNLSPLQQQKADFCSPGNGVTPGDAQGIFNAYLGLSNPCQ